MMNTPTLTLLIDDEKNIQADVVARNSKAALLLLPLKCWAHILLDNDLGEKMEGHHILEWMVEEDCLPPTITLVTNNPPARDFMKKFLLRQGYKTRAGDPFTLDKM